MEGKDSALEALASCFEYPSVDLVSKLERAAEIVERQNSEAARLIGRFRGFIASIPLGFVEALHAQIFDMEPACCLYVGYHVFGDTHRRGMFLAGLREWYGRYGFSVDGELPDYLPVLLRFLSRAEEGPDKSELIQYCMIPAIESIARGVSDKKSPYGDLITAIRLLVSR